MAIVMATRTARSMRSDMNFTPFGVFSVQLDNTVAMAAEQCYAPWYSSKCSICTTRVRVECREALRPLPAWREYRRRAWTGNLAGGSLCGQQALAGCMPLQCQALAVPGPCSARPLQGTGPCRGQ